MAIQFVCGACGQPIEVDDEAAGQAVTCPYCYKVTTTPTANELASGKPTGGSADETAPAGPSDAAAGGVSSAALGEQVEPMPQAGEPDQTPKRSVLGWIALASIVLSIICVTYAILTAISMTQDLHGQQPKTPEQMAELQRIVQQRMASKPSLTVIGLAGICVLPLVAVVLAVIALFKRSRPRWPAITTLVLVGLLVVAACGGMIFQAVAAGGAASG